MAFRLISTAAALPLFVGRGIEVQTATLGKLPVKDDNGKKVGERDGLIVASAKLDSEEHILAGSAKQYDDGKVTITTVDGQRYEARAKARTEQQADAKTDAKTDKKA